MEVMVWMGLGLGYLGMGPKPMKLSYLGEEISNKHPRTSCFGVDTSFLGLI